MLTRRQKLVPLADRGPLRVMFITTSMPVGGAETLLVNLVRRLDRDRFAPSLCCLKSLGPLGRELADEVPAFHDLIRSRYDAAVVVRLAHLLCRQRTDAVVTVGAGDKMFWGRIAARLAGVPVICAAVHSTGWPDVITRANRLPLLTRWTDAFLAVAEAHGQHLVEVERFPAEKVHVIPNGIDVAAFHQESRGVAVRRKLGIDPLAPLVGIVAALRPEKDHELFLRAAAQVRLHVPAAQFLVVGDGPLRNHLEHLADELRLFGAAHFLGTRNDIPELLSALDTFVLTSRMEASPVSILEAMASGKPVVAPRVGSIPQSVIDGETGFLFDAGDQEQLTGHIVELLTTPELAARMGQRGRAAVSERGSLETMVEGYQRLLTSLYETKAGTAPSQQPTQAAEPVPTPRLPA